jgi:anti-sigma factor (TIGR02949 family)
MISCSEAVERLWEYLENAVTADDRHAIEEHLAFCRRCCGEVAFAEELRGVLAEAGQVELPPAVEQRLTDALDEVDADPAGTTRTFDTDEGARR